MKTTYADSWSDIAQPCDMDLWILKWRSAWHIFHDPVILPYILKTIWYMNIILWDYKSVWPYVWPHNKCRSLWPIFNGPVILPYILKIIWCMNIIPWDYESVWPNVRPQNKCRSLWPIFHGPVILCYILKTIWCMNVILWDYESVWPDFWSKNKRKLLQYDLYFSVLWFCLVLWRLFDVGTSYFVIMSQCDVAFDPKKYRSLWPIFSWSSYFATYIYLE